MVGLRGAASRPGAVPQVKGLVARRSRDPARVAVVPLLEAGAGARSDGHAHGHAHRAHATPGGQRGHAARRVLILLAGARHREARHRRHRAAMRRQVSSTCDLGPVSSPPTSKNNSLRRRTRACTLFYFIFLEMILVHVIGDLANII